LSAALTRLVGGVALLNDNSPQAEAVQSQIERANRKLITAVAVSGSTGKIWLAARYPDNQDVPSGKPQLTIEGALNIATAFRKASEGFGIVEILTFTAKNLGMSPFGTVGEHVVFNPFQHEDVSGGLLRGDAPAQFWITAAQDLDAAFVKLFRERSTPDARLLVLNALGQKQSTDSFFTHLMGLQIRSAHRLYVADWPSSGSVAMSDYLAPFLQRLAATSSSDENSPRILHAGVFAGMLHVVSPDFNRLEIPIARISALAAKTQAELNEFEIDEDGAFIYWPKFDVHLGWEQLEQIINPAAALKAQQKQAAFNVRYGQAVKKLREQLAIKPAEIADLSEKQLGRIERGECRLTSNAIEILAKAHKLSPNEYLNKIAECLRQPSAHSFHTVISGSCRFVPKSRKIVAR